MTGYSSAGFQASGERAAGYRETSFRAAEFGTDRISERTIKEARYISETGCTVRTCATVMGTSKSTVHKDITERLASLDPQLYESVKRVLERNLQERHLRGGDATRRKYERKRKKLP